MTPPAATFSFIDLFAGIGGIRLGFEAAGGRCILSAEYDRYAQKTYRAFFGDTPDFSDVAKVTPPGDITQLPPHLVPDHDILVGGFPCQPFSLAGVSKKQSLGRPHGFDDPTQGTLFFNVKEILRVKRPKAFLLENVKNLCSHDSGRTFSVIRAALQELDYHLHYRVVDAIGWLPQHRERIFLVGFRKPSACPTGDQTWDVDRFDLNKVVPKADPVPLVDVLERAVPDKYTLGPGTWDTLVRHKANHAAKGQGFGYGMISPPFEGRTTRTLSARYHKDGAEILIDQGGARRPRRLTPLECCRLMGFPPWCQRWFDRNDEAHPQPVSDCQAYRQFGNSVAVPVVTAIAKAMVKAMRRCGAI